MNRHVFLYGVIAAMLIPGSSTSAAPGADRGIEATREETLQFKRAHTLAGRGEASRARDYVGTRFQSDTGRAFEVRMLTELGNYAMADSLLQENAPLSDDRRLFLHYLQRARLAEMNGNTLAALDHLEHISEIVDPLFGCYRDFLLVSLLVAIGEPARATAILERTPLEEQPWAVRTDFYIAAVRAYYYSGDSKTAERLIARGVKRLRGYSARAQLTLVAYEIAADAGHHDRARKSARTLAKQYPGDQGTAAVVDEILAGFAATELSTAELFIYSDYLVSNSEFSAARELLRALDSRKLNSASRETRRLRWAQYYYKSGNMAKAATLAKPTYRDPSNKRNSILILARSYRRLDREGDAARLYEYFAREFPNDRKAAEALFVASRIYERAGNDKSAERVRTLMRRSYPSSYFGKLASLQSGRYQMQQGNSQDAIAILSSRVKRSRRTDAAAMFYLAQAYGKTGDKQRNELFLNEIKKLNPYSFYLSPAMPGFYLRPTLKSSGALAMDGDGGLFEFLDRADVSKALAVDRIASVVGLQPGVEIDCIDRARWFLDAGFRDWGEAELRQADRECHESTAEMLALADIYETYAMPWRSVRLYQRIQDAIHWKVRREYATDFRWLLYPTPFPIQVFENAARYDLPPHLVYAMIREESRFEVDVVSRAGAVGLMQLMPATGRQVARELELPDWVEEDLENPEINLALGIWYAASLLERADDNPHRMLAAYNAGPGNAARWFGGRSDDDIIGAVDDIDFRETRGYVRRIVESANVYHSLYFDPDGPVHTR